MTCIHLRRLFQLCEEEDIKLTGSDLVHIVCTQCGVKETCPAVMMDEFESGGTDQPAGNCDVASHREQN